MAYDPKSKLLPRTKARVASSISIYATVNGEKFRIGAVKELSRTISRNTSRRLELDSDVPGRTVEIIPGSISGFNITIKRAMLYSGSMLEAFGFDKVEDLIFQNFPIEIEETRHSPNGNTQIVTYTGCYFTSNPVDYNIEGDWQVIQSATLEVTTANVTNPPTGE